jgi:hypothetical protein
LHPTPVEFGFLLVAYLRLFPCFPEDIAACKSLLPPEPPPEPPSEPTLTAEPVPWVLPDPGTRTLPPPAPVSVVDLLELGLAEYLLLIMLARGDVEHLRAGPDSADGTPCFVPANSLIVTPASFFRMTEAGKLPR